MIVHIFFSKEMINRENGLRVFAVNGLCRLMQVHSIRLLLPSTLSVLDKYTHTHKEKRVSFWGRGSVVSVVIQ